MDKTELPKPNPVETSNTSLSCYVIHHSGNKVFSMQGIKAAIHWKILQIQCNQIAVFASLAKMQIRKTIHGTVGSLSITSSLESLEILLNSQSTRWHLYTKGLWCIARYSLRYSIGILSVNSPSSVQLSVHFSVHHRYALGGSTDFSTLLGTVFGTFFGTSPVRRRYTLGFSPWRR